MEQSAKIPPLDQWVDHTEEVMGTGAPQMTYTRQDELVGQVVYSIRRSELTFKWHPQVSADGKKTYRGLRGYKTPEEAYAALLRQCKQVPYDDEMTPSK